jgi:hypothetical protein
VPTTIHVPPALLKRVDARAKALGVSRNRFIIETLNEKLQSVREWPEDFVRALKQPVRADVAATADDMLRQIESTRRSRKAPPKLA